MQLIFLKNGEKSDRALDSILSLIANTKGPLRIVVAYFNHIAIADALVKRSERGLSTFIIVNSADLVRPVEGHVEYEVSEALLRILGKASIQVRTLGLPSPQYHSMHHKFAVGDDRAIFGSVNWTRAALGSNFELMAVTEVPAEVSAFEREFDWLWEQAHLIAGLKGALRVIICPNCGQSNSVDFESWGALCVSCMSEFRPRNSHG